MVYIGGYEIDGKQRSKIFCEDRKTIISVLMGRIENDVETSQGYFTLYIVPAPPVLGALAAIYASYTDEGAVIMHKDDVQYIDVPAKE